MRRLHTKVNLIPVIAKADTMTDEEILQFKQRILSDIAHQGIAIYQAPRYDKEDEETILENEEIVRKIPFAIVGSDSVVNTPDGRQVRGRSYPWGTIEVDNEDHCDFVKLRQMLIRTHMEELKEHTNLSLYEKYRSEKLLGMGVTQDHSVFKEVNPAAKMAEERALHESKLQKMEAEMKMGASSLRLHLRARPLSEKNALMQIPSFFRSLPAEGQREGGQAQAVRGGALRAPPRDEGGPREAAPGPRGEEAPRRERPAAHAREGPYLLPW